MIPYESLSPRTLATQPNCAASRREVMGAEEVMQWSDVTEADLRDAVESFGVVAVSEAYRRHGPAAFNLARAITQDAVQAEQAVVAAFVRLTTDERNGEVQTLRVELLNLTRRCAGDLAKQRTAPSPLHVVGSGDVFRTLPLEARSMLALAVVARCGDTEIAQIMGSDTSVVRRTLLMALGRARELLDSPG